MLTPALVTSCLDYCDSAFFDLAHKSLHKLQLVQNSAAGCIILDFFHWKHQSSLTLSKSFTGSWSTQEFKQSLHNLAPISFSHTHTLLYTEIFFSSASPVCSCSASCLLTSLSDPPFKWPLGQFVPFYINQPQHRHHLPHAKKGWDPEISSSDTHMPFVVPLMVAWCQQAALHRLFYLFVSWTWRFWKECGTVALLKHWATQTNLH